MRALVIGATGQDGKYICDQLIDAGLDVFGIARNPNHRISGAAKQEKTIKSPILSHIEMSDSRAAKRYLDEVKPDLIFHVAAVHESSLNMQALQQQSAIEMHECHVNITENVLQWQKRNLGSKSIFALSSKMYQPYALTDRVIDEYSFVNPGSVYGSTKVKAWEIIKKYRTEYDLKCAAAILFNHTSPLSKPQFLLPTLHRGISDLIKKKKSSIVVADKNSRVSFLHAEEVASLLIKISLETVSNDYVIGSPEFVTIEELITQTLIKLEISPHRHIISSTNEREINPIVIPNISKVSQSFSWQPDSNAQRILTNIIEASI